MAKSSFLKLDRARKHVREIRKIVRESEPFTYVLKTNTITGDRTTGVEKNEAVIDQIALVGGEAAYAIRSALDHAYWEIVSPFAATPREKKNVQFPFSRTVARLEEGVRNRLADRVSDRFFDQMIRLAPHPEEGGNRLLYLVEQICGTDKHRHLTPVAAHADISSDRIRAQVPDYPGGLTNVRVSNFSNHVSWRTDSIARSTLGNIIPPTSHMFEKKLDVPIGIELHVTEPHFLGPYVATLEELITLVSEVITIMKTVAAKR